MSNPNDAYISPVIMVPAQDIAAMRQRIQWSLEATNAELARRRRATDVLRKLNDHATLYGSLPDELAEEVRQALFPVPFPKGFT